MKISVSTLILALSSVFAGCTAPKTTTTTSTSSTIYLLTDYANNRVLIYDSLPTSASSTPSLVLGQADLVSEVAATTATGMTGPGAAMYDGTHLLVADRDNHRVLIWNSKPTSNGQAADLVLGQANMTGGVANRGGAASASTLNTPWGVYSNGTRIFVADYNNNRILIWNSWPTANGQAADLVLGQPDMTTVTANTGGVSSQSLSGPSVTSDGTHLFVGEEQNNRVLIWNTLPTTNREAADVVVGQPNMTSNTSGVTATTMEAPWGVSTDGTRLAVADYNNNRVLIFNTIPTTDGATANIVLGQANMTTNTANSGGLSSTSLSGPYHAQFLGSSLYVVDATNHRVLVWSSVPTTNNQAATGVIGQTNFTSNSADGGSTVSGTVLETPTHIK